MNNEQYSAKPDRSEIDEAGELDELTGVAPAGDRVIDPAPSLEDAMIAKQEAENRGEIGD